MGAVSAVLEVLDPQTLVHGLFGEAVQRSAISTKPMSLSEKRAAALRLLEEDRTGTRAWSDRHLAQVVELSPTTVGKLRMSVQNGRPAARKEHGGDEQTDQLLRDIRRLLDHSTKRDIAIDEETLIDGLEAHFGEYSVRRRDFARTDCEAFSEIFRRASR